MFSLILGSMYFVAAFVALAIDKKDSVRFWSFVISSNIFIAAQIIVEACGK